MQIQELELDHASVSGAGQEELSRQGAAVAGRVGCCELLGLLRGQGCVGIGAVTHPEAQ